MTSYIVHQRHIVSFHQDGMETYIDTHKDAGDVDVAWGFDMKNDWKGFEEVFVQKMYSLIETVGLVVLFGDLNTNYCDILMA